MSRTGNGSKTVRLYDVRGDRGQWLGRFIITDDGYFSTVSDYGNYAFWWSHAGSCFRRFLTNIDAGYLLGKISRSSEYDGDRTVKAARRHILEQRKEGGVTKEWAREEWDLINDHSSLDSRESFAMWWQNTKIDCAHEFSVFDFPGDAKAFATIAFPAFVKVLVAELERESRPHSCVFCG